MPGPIFIVGAMGSGTTLLRLMLDAHERIAIPQETGFMRAYDAHRYVPFKASGKNWIRRLGWTDEERDELFTELYQKLFMRYAEEHGKQRWGEKTPLHTWHLDDIARLFPDVVFIGVVRHPAASVASNMTRFNHPFARSRRHWIRYTSEMARQAACFGDRFSLIRYEDLVTEPEPIMRELLEWLGEPWSDAVLQHHEVQSARGGKARVEGRSRSDEPIDTSRIGKWKTTLTRKQRARLGERMARQAAFFGYGMDEPLPVAPLAASGGHVVYGPELDRRIDEFADLDLRTRGPVPVPDTYFDPRTRVVLSREQFDALAGRSAGARDAGASLARRARAKLAMRRRARRAR